MAPSAPSINFTTKGDGESSPRLVDFNPALASVLVAMVISFVVVGFAARFLKRCVRPAEDDDDDDGRPRSRARRGSRTRKPLRGLDPEIVESLPFIQYKDLPPRLQENLDCSVCLAAFDVDDCLRLLPECSHAFHSDCIGAWFRSHNTCPLCRACLGHPRDKAISEEREGNGEQAAIHMPEGSDVVEVVIHGDPVQDSSSNPAGSRFPQERTGRAPIVNPFSEKEEEEEERVSTHSLLPKKDRTFKPAVRVVVAHEKASALVAIRRSNSTGADFQLLHPSFVVDSEGTQHNRNYQTHAIDVGEFHSKDAQAQSTDSPSRHRSSLAHHDWLPASLEAGASSVINPVSRLEPQRNSLSIWSFLNIRRP